MLHSKYHEIYSDFEACRIMVEKCKTAYYKEFYVKAGWKYRKLDIVKDFVIIEKRIERELYVMRFNNVDKEIINQRKLDLEAMEFLRMLYRTLLTLKTNEEILDFCIGAELFKKAIYLFNRKIGRIVDCFKDPKKILERFLNLEIVSEIKDVINAILDNIQSNSLFLDVSKCQGGTLSSN